MTVLKSVSSKGSLWVFLSIVLTSSTCIGAAEVEQTFEKSALTPEELENYQFGVEKTQFVVEELTVGQLHILDLKRKAAKDLLARKIGIISIRGNRKDLHAFQQLIDRRILRDNQVEEWQALGVLFGDVIANEFNMTWVLFKDELGASKALRWRTTDNFIFPVTLFSKRVRFGDPINVQQIYDKLADEVDGFKKWERKPRFKKTS